MAWNNCHYNSTLFCLLLVINKVLYAHFLKSLELWQYQVLTVLGFSTICYLCLSKFYILVGLGLIKVIFWFSFIYTMHTIIIFTMFHELFDSNILRFYHLRVNMFSWFKRTTYLRVIFFIGQLDCLYPLLYVPWPFWQFLRLIVFGPLLFWQKMINFDFKLKRFKCSLSIKDANFMWDINISK